MLSYGPNDDLCDCRCTGGFAYERVARGTVLRSRSTLTTEHIAPKDPTLFSIGFVQVLFSWGHAGGFQNAGGAVTSNNTIMTVQRSLFWSEDQTPLSGRRKCSRCGRHHSADKRKRSTSSSRRPHLSSLLRS